MFIIVPLASIILSLELNLLFALCLFLFLFFAVPGLGYGF